MGTLTELSGEYVIFDQNGRKCNFGLLAAKLPNWQFWRINGVIRTIERIGKARIFWYFNFFKNLNDDVIFLRNIKIGHFGKNPNKTEQQ